VAQLVAHLHGMQGVRGSSPLRSTKIPDQKPFRSPYSRSLRWLLGAHWALQPPPSDRPGRFTYGTISIRCAVRHYVAETRFRDADGRLRKVHATAASRANARTLLKERLLQRPGYGSGGILSLASPFRDLAALWLTDLETRELSEGTKENYCDDLRLHVLPAFEHYTLGEITTGRVDWFLKAEAQPGRRHLGSAQAERRAVGAHTGTDHRDPRKGTTSNLTGASTPPQQPTFNARYARLIPQTTSGLRRTCCVRVRHHRRTTGC
jgi:hypothetical protein